MQKLHKSTIEQMLIINKTILGPFRGRNNISVRNDGKYLKNGFFKHL